MKFLLLVLIFTSITPSYAVVPREIKEKIGKGLDDNEEFKIAVLDYVEMYDKLYDEEVSANVESFKTQYRKYVKSKRCMGFLSSFELLGKMMNFANELDNELRKKPNYDKVQKLMNESYPIQASYKNLAAVDGYKDCSFKVSEATIKSNLATLDPSVRNSNLSTEDKKKLIFKDNKSLQMAVDVLIADQKEVYTNQKITDQEREILADKLESNMMCVLFFASSDQMMSVVTVLSEETEAFKKNPNYIKDANKIFEKKKPNPTFKPDYTKCSFTPDPIELEQFQKNKAEEKKVVDDNYFRIQRLLVKAHPKIKEMSKQLEDNITASVKDQEMSRMMYVNQLSGLLDQVNMTLTYSMHGMLKDKQCSEEVLKHVEKCALDERFALIKDKTNLLMSMCVQESKEELKGICKIN